MSIGSSDDRGWAPSSSTPRGSLPPLTLAGEADAENTTREGDAVTGLQTLNSIRTVQLDRSLPLLRVFLAFGSIIFPLSVL
jgi:hypothetical protein